MQIGIINYMTISYITPRAYGLETGLPLILLGETVKTACDNSDDAFDFCRDVMDDLKKRIAKLGFRLMRLPRLEDGETIDVEQVKQMVDAFIDAGCTYFDTARAYGESENAIRQALVERYPRDSFYLASKNAAWIGPKTREEARRDFDACLKHADDVFGAFVGCVFLGDYKGVHLEVLVRVYDIIALFVVMKRAAHGTMRAVRTTQKPDERGPVGVFGSCRAKR